MQHPQSIYIASQKSTYFPDFSSSTASTGNVSFKINQWLFRLLLSLWQCWAQWPKKTLFHTQCAHSFLGVWVRLLRKSSWKTVEQASSTKASSFKASSCWSFKLQASTAWSQKIFSQLPQTLILYNGNNYCQCAKPRWQTNTFGLPKMHCVQHLLRWDAKKLQKLKNPNQAQNTPKNPNFSWHTSSHVWDSSAAITNSILPKSKTAFWQVYIPASVDSLLSGKNPFQENSSQSEQV